LKEAQGDTKVKKTIWMPLVLGITLGLLNFVSIAVDFIIPLGPFGATGPQEILLTISAALGGPLGALVANFLQELSFYLFWLKTQLPPEQIWSTGALFSIADFTAHMVALLAVAYGYRFLHQRAKKVVTFLAGWILIVVIYYALLVLLQSFLIGLVIPDKPPLSTLYQNNLPEFLVVTIVSTLAWIALPRRYQRPLWIESQLALPPAEEIAVYEEIQT
jgi:hypothetical protein